MDQPADDQNGDARMTRERNTIAAMVRIYCRGHHVAVDDLCPACQELYDYAMQRLDRCVFGAEKPTCARCPIHCYKPLMRERVRQVMRYAGPRMLLRHPILAIRHKLDNLRPPAEKPGSKCQHAATDQPGDTDVPSR